MESLQKTRDLFPVTKSKTFMNHAAQSPLPRPVAGAIHKFADNLACLETLPEEWSGYGKPLFAKLISARPGEIALVENTSTGLSIVANALRYPQGSKIVTTDLEYPSVVYPWLRKSMGTKVHYVKTVNGKISLDDMEKAVDDKTAAIAISHVEYMNGFRHNLRILSEIAHEHGAYLIVDAIQSVGTMPIDVKRDGVDFLTAACYKWLLSPPGAGYLYVKDEHIEKLEPPIIGWASVDQETFETLDFWNIWELKLSKTASRFEAGSPSTVCYAAACEAMKLLLGVKTERIQNRILKLTDYLIEHVKHIGLKLQTPEERQLRSGIVNFKVRNAQKLAEHLGRKGIVVSARNHGIRVSPHFYNTEEEIDRLLQETKHQI